MALQASTYTNANALAVIQGFIKNAPLTTAAYDGGYRLLDMAHQQIWRFFPWSWAQATATVSISAGTAQDLSASSTNILKLLRARLTRTDVDPDDDNDLIVKTWNAPTPATVGWKSIQSVAYNRITDEFRFDKQLETPSDITLVFEYDHWKIPTKVTSSIGSSVIQLPDTFFNVFVSGILYYAYLHSDDPRAGGVQINRQGNAIYTGQYGVFMHELEQMVTFEDQAAETIHPSVPLGASDIGPGGLFG